MIKIAIIWGFDEKEPVYSTHHHFWHQTINSRPDCSVDRFTWGNWREMSYDYDLYFFVGFHHDLFSLYDKNYHPRVFYWWDCAVGGPFAYQSQLTELFDKSYFAQFSTAAFLQFQGLNVKWLPPAFDPEVYKPLPDSKKVYDFCFVGQMDHVVRRKGLTRFDFIDKLSKKYPACLVSSDMISYDINEAFSKSKILFDRTAVLDSSGTRFFETIGSKGFCLMNRTTGNNSIGMLAVDGLHYVSYDDSYQDFISKFDYYLNHSEEREQIATQGYEYFLKNHTYNHRLDVILRDFQLTK